MNNGVLPTFEINAKITVSARSKEEAERLLDSKLIRLESDVILKTERVETKQMSEHQNRVPIDLFSFVSIE